MEPPNRMALDLVDEAIDFADVLNIGVHHLDNAAAVLDFGVEHRGGVEAGLLLAEVAAGGLATVQSRLGTVDGVALTHVEVTTDHPTRSLHHCQTPGWELQIDETVGKGYGPGQLLRRSPDHGERRKGLDEADFVVLGLEIDRLPDESLVEEISEETSVPTSGIFVLAAPASSIAGGIVSSARVAERALRRFVAIGDDPRDVRSITASSPVPPLAPSDAEARALSTAAIAAGGRAQLHVQYDVEAPREIAGTESDDVTAPAQITIDVIAGPTYVVGRVDEIELAADLGL